MKAHEIHPAAALFPLMDDAGIATLAADIRANGLRMPIVRHEGQILDGRNRLAACERAGVAPTFEEWSGEGDPIVWVVSVNLHRRHLDESQRAMVGSRVEGMFRDAARERMLRGKKANPVANLPEGPRRARDDAARVVNVSPRMVSSASKVRTSGSPSLVAACDAGKVPVSVGAAVAALPAREQERVVALVEEGRKPHQAVAAVRREVIQERVAAEPRSEAQGLVRDLAAVSGRYRTIYADPPWEYDDSGSRGAAAHHYPTMSLEALAALPFGELAHEEGAHLWLWTTWPMIREGAPHRLCDSWGFVWSGEVVWDKERMGTGRWLRSQTEVLILAVRGSIPMLANDQAGILRVARGEHSVKPLEAAAIVERLSAGPRIEMFARAPRAGWDRWGLEASATLAKEGAA